MNKRFYELQFEIENACLLDCVHCSSAEMRKSGIRGYSDEELLRFLSIFQGKLHIYFTGGEPLLYDSLLALCDQITTQNENAVIGLYTTGNCADGKPISEFFSNQMKQAGIVDCYFSIYSDKETEHDAWTATKGALRNTIESVNILKKVGIATKAHLVLNKFNQDQIKQTIRFCKEIRMEEVRVLKLTPTGSAKRNWIEIGIPIEEQNEIIRRLICESSQYSVRLTFSGYPTLFPCRSWEDADGCQAGINLLYIDADGYVFPCACTKRNPSKFTIGHITELGRITEYLTKDHSAKNEMCLNELAD